MRILPPHPLQLDPTYLWRLRRRFWLTSALLLFAAGCFLTGCAYGARKLLDERSLWEHGVAGKIASLSSEVSERTLLGITLVYEYKLDVRYLDASGAPHHGESRFDLLWSPLPADLSGATLRYDPLDPARFALSSPLEAGWPRWGRIPLMGAMACVTLIGLVLYSLAHPRRMRAFAICAQDGQEIVASLLWQVRHRRTIWLNFSLPHRAKPVREVMRDEPLL